MYKQQVSLLFNHQFSSKIWFGICSSSFFYFPISSPILALTRQESCPYHSFQLLTHDILATLTALQNINQRWKTMYQEDDQLSSLEPLLCVHIFSAISCIHYNSISIQWIYSWSTWLKQYLLLRTIDIKKQHRSTDKNPQRGLRAYTREKKTATTSMVNCKGHIAGHINIVKKQLRSITYHHIRGLTFKHLLLHKGCYLQYSFASRNYLFYFLTTTTS